MLFTLLLIAVAAASPHMRCWTASGVELSSRLQQLLMAIAATRLHQVGTTARCVFSG